jgi:hypothetical protein
MNFEQVSNDIRQNFDSWEFNNVFERKGIAAVCGTLKRKIDTNYPEIVYKISAYHDRVCEHEEMILSKINELKQYTPHFVGLYDSKVIPITNKFIDDNAKYICKCENCKSDKNKNEKHTLFTTTQNTKDSRERLVLFLEYVSNIHLKHALRANDNQLSACQLIMSLAAVHQGIEHANLCHYDLHIDNILLKECELDSYFAYRFKNGKMLLTPTRGYYPVIIDFGTSHIADYINPTKKNKCRTSIVNSYNGLQPVLFDKLIDSHQLIISSMFELEKVSEMYRYISTKFMEHFSNIIIFREQGWKKMPFDIFNLITDKIIEYEPSIEDDYPIMTTKQSELIDLLTLSIALPFKPLSSDEKQSLYQKYIVNNPQLNKVKREEDKISNLLAITFKDICIQITNIQRSLNLITTTATTIKTEQTDNNIICSLQSDEIYYIIREIVEADRSQLDEIRLKYKMGKKCNLVKLWNTIQDNSVLLSHFYYQYFLTNKEIIDEWYSSISFQDSIDIAYFLESLVPIKPLSEKIVNVHCFDSMTQSKTVKQIDTSTYQPGNKWRQTILNQLFSTSS